MSKRPLPLTKMQANFCTAYVSNGFNAYRAAIEAGYSHHKARHGITELTKNPQINNAITNAANKANQSIIDKLGITFEWRAEKLKLIINAIVSEEQVRLTYAKIAISAVAELNKMSGDYAPDKSLRLNVDMTKERLKDVKKAYEEY